MRQTHGQNTIPSLMLNVVNQALKSYKCVSFVFSLLLCETAISPEISKYPYNLLQCSKSKVYHHNEQFYTDSSL